MKQVSARVPARYKNLASHTAGANPAAGSAGLVGLYLFSQGAGTVLSDQSGLGNSGTIEGTVSWTTP